MPFIVVSDHFLHARTKLSLLLLLFLILRLLDRLIARLLFIFIYTPIQVVTNVWSVDV